MKKLVLIALLSFCNLIFAQDKGTVNGLVTDKELNNEALPFANVFIKNTTIGSTTDMDGKYSLQVPAGNHTIVFSFVGYETVEKAITVKASQNITINQALGANQGVSLDEVEIKATTSKEKSSALLLEQKKATIIKESIGAEELAAKGVSNASNATTKISGVTKSQGSGDIFIRGLGDRYLATTMNGLPIPSDDVEKKNINLDLFSTNVIQNVGISKTYSSHSHADQSSGNVDIITKNYKKGYKISVSGGTNSNVLDNFSTFRRTVISDDVTFGFHKKTYALVNQITKQGWDPKKQNTPLDYSFTLSGGEKFKLLNKDVSVFATASHSESFWIGEGSFKSFRSNVLDNSFSDVQQYESRINTTGYVRANIKFNDYNNIKYNTLFVNKGVDVLYEQGRNGLGYVFDQDPQEDGAFVRDQNYKQTTMFINQLLGDHWLNNSNKLKWAAGYNYVLAEEPNRIRNEVNILDINTASTIQYAHVGDFQQRKSSQKIKDIEYNAFVENQWNLFQEDDFSSSPFKLNYGVNFRRKERTFTSLFIGVRAKDFTADSVDNLSSTFTTSGFNNGLILRERKHDRYDANLNVIAGYVNMDFKLEEKLSGNIGFRFEKNDIDVIWDVANYNNPNTGAPRVGNLNKEYSGIYPSINLKYELNENQFLRFASSITQTLPEFKEFSPFEYVSPTGRVTKGNPDLEKSEVYNYDLKYEFFPSRGQLISATAFYKQIKNPINLSQVRGSSGNFVYSNTGKEATVFGFEAEGRLDILKNNDEQTILNATANVTKMWLNQDLLENFQYKNKTESNLQGASDLILNGSLTYNNKKEKPFIATLTANYSSDKIFALGAPEDKTNSATLYNDEIIEKGFVTLDAVLSKKLTNKLSVKLIGRNILNPEIKQTQLVRNLNTGIETNETVFSYKKGQRLSLSFSYNF